ncbi:hypothetical protein LWI28_008445 [Acer negundo]|uniref:Uncharacterized protein n=1 Tax=Acer negundo TaxID=4023 RepID=A0AAD5IE16_ACENE|nr:hypothetical protein LWI28_008445 [Acer negundo]KAK4838204.1 hypothetical protein QYF36_011901 [Acer negundo]
MERLSIVSMFFIFFMFLLLVDNNHATNIPDNHDEAPSPQPQPEGQNNTMHGVTQGSLKPQECGPRCSTRCSKTQYKKPCLFFCNKCCAKCLCVPAGFYGNKESCPCYNNWKTKRGGPKCP